MLLLLLSRLVVSSSLRPHGLLPRKRLPDWASPELSPSIGDPQLHGARDHVFGSYIVQKGLAVPELRDEILAQLANQVWRNPSSHNAERGWLLLAACLSGFAPSPRLDKYLLK